MDWKDLIGKDMRHVLHPWADLSTLHTAEPMLVERAHGYHVFDAQGNRYVDGIGGMWCMTVGYGRRELAEAMLEQSLKMPYYTPFGAMTNAPACTLAAELASLAPGDLNRVHFTTCGSTAVESALRFAHYYFQVTGRPQKKHIISRTDAYHGSTYLAASVCGKAVDKTYFQFEERLVHHVSSPNPYYRSEEISLAEFCDRKVNELEEMILRLGPQNVACFISEPILASGGVIVPPDGYHRRTLETCRKYDVLYISDEVVTGFGRLGHFFSSLDRFSVVPDILITAKGLTSGYQPLGAAIISDRLITEISGANAPDAPTFTNGLTYSGHPVACAVASRNIQLMKEEKICEHVRKIGPYFMEQLQTLREYPIVAEVRGDHLMACVECRVSRHKGPATNADIVLAQKVDDVCYQMGVLVRPYENLCILSPPLIIDQEGIDRIVEVMRRAILAAMKEMGKPC
ncbi:aminotransferase [Noviherbaspirillum sp. ST9]|uniref:aminotransferase n=1 Tax=Noviherbaspirillum sp. ST9 TaxID=3401606 RepID=UPI003B58A4FE